jgi:hypothetical protein
LKRWALACVLQRWSDPAMLTKVQEDSIVTVWLRAIYLSLHLFFWWDWGLNSGLCAGKAGALLLEPHLQSILLWLFWRGWGPWELFSRVDLELRSSGSLSLPRLDYRPLAP